MSLKRLDSKEKRDISYMFSLVTQLGISMMVPIFLCMFVGIYINKYIDNGIIIVISMIVGCIVAFRNVYLLLAGSFVKDLEKENEEIKYYKELEEKRKEHLKKKDEQIK